MLTAKHKVAKRQLTKKKKNKQLGEKKALPLPFFICEKKTLIQFARLFLLDFSPIRIIRLIVQAAACFCFLRCLARKNARQARMYLFVIRHTTFSRSCVIIDIDAPMVQKRKVITPPSISPDSQSSPASLSRFPFSSSSCS
eukprot:TRINITY_DN21721_c0_g1_i1.p1 TRINITY_DN21721_c0_g1~~TRINITY_DN21721_c0_g1_i1.p1  ORF type:complete len:141 (+),score=1.51 TRINITY_DN21721_c0_g1_i1:1277-1699(+)